MIIDPTCRRLQREGFYRIAHADTYIKCLAPSLKLDYNPRSLLPIFDHDPFVSVTAKYFYASPL
jgi:hypothetical protein